MIKIKMEYINFIWPRNINMSISSCHIFLKCDQEADKNLEYSLNFVRTDLILIFIFEFDTNLLRNKSGQKFVQHGFWAWEGISPFLEIHKKIHDVSQFKMLLIDEKQDLTFTRR